MIIKREVDTTPISVNKQSANLYTQQQVNRSLSNIYQTIGSKSDKINTYTKTEVTNIIPTKTSQLTNDSGFVTLSDVYSKSEIDEMIGDISSILDEINGEII